MLRNFLPEFMDQDEQRVIDTLLDSLTYLKNEALREGQGFIAYAIEDAILQTKAVIYEKYTAPHDQICSNEGRKVV